MGWSSSCRATKRWRSVNSGGDGKTRCLTWTCAIIPPVGPVRNCAEWEPTTGVMVRYPLGLPYNLLRDFDDQVTIHVVVSSTYLSSATSALTSNGVDMDKVEFLVRANDSIWTRDYGPWFIFDANGEVGIVNHTYNRPWRPNDNNIPPVLRPEPGASPFTATACTTPAATT